MRRIIISIIAAVSLLPAAMNAQTSYHSPYEINSFIQKMTRCDAVIFTSEVQTYTSRNFERTDSVIPQGHVCVRDEHNNCYFEFFLAGAAESLYIKDNYIEYYKPAQDNIPASYIPISALLENTRLVNYSEGFSPNWGIMVPYMFSCDNPAISSLTIRKIKVKDPDLVFVTGYYNVQLYNKIIYEICEKTWRGHIKTYIFEGQEVSSYDNENKALIGDDSGFFYEADRSTGKVKRISKLIVERGCIPNYCFFMPISDTEVIINANFYKLDKNCYSKLK